MKLNPNPFVEIALKVLHHFGLTVPYPLHGDFGVKNLFRLGAPSLAFFHGIHTLRIESKPKKNQNNTF